MRRKDKEIQDRREIEALIDRAAVCRLGLCCENVPYVVPLSFGYREGRLYFHSAKEGRKIDMIRKNPRVCFEIDTGAEVIPSEKPCDWGVEYASVIGFGEASVLEDPQEKRKGLDVILGHYSSRHSHEYPASVLEQTAVIKVQVQEMTGKRSGRGRAGKELSVPSPSMRNEARCSVRQHALQGNSRK